MALLVVNEHWNIYELEIVTHPTYSKVQENLHIEADV